jgi:hypothetical protein
MNEIGIVAAIVSAFTDSWQFIRSFQKKEDSNIPIISLIEQQSDETYRVGLGRRHRFLREKILEINSVEMSRFYRFKNVKCLENCESGSDEFPLESIKRLKQVFFISSKYIEENQKEYPTPIFEPFDITGLTDIRFLLEQGFKPCILCSPNFDQYGFFGFGQAYIIFWKKEEGYYRMRKSNNCCRFYSPSSGGGRNLYNLIDAILEFDLTHTGQNILCLTTHSDEWEKLERGCWYNQRLLYSGIINDKASDVFKDCYKERLEILER